MAFRTYLPYEHQIVLTFFAVAYGSNLPSKNANHVPCLDVDNIDDDASEKNCMINAAFGTGGSNATVTFALQYNSLGAGTHTYCMLDQEHRSSCSELEMRTSSPNGSSPEESPSNSPLLESSSNVSELKIFVQILLASCM